MRCFLNSDTFGTLPFDREDPEIAKFVLEFRVPEEKLSSRGAFTTHAEVIVFPYLPDGFVGFAQFSLIFDGSGQRVRLHGRNYFIRSIGDVLTQLRFGGFRGDYETLEALLTSKPDIEPLPNGPNVLTESGRKSSNVASEKDSKYVRLALAYVEWVDKLPEYELIRLFGHGRPSLCPRLAMDAFKSYDREKALKLGVTSRADERIREVIEADQGLHARMKDLTAKARSLRKH